MFAFHLIFSLSLVVKLIFLLLCVAIELWVPLSILTMASILAFKF
jgi:hypothetical protein